MSSFKPHPDCLYQIHNGLRYTIKRVKDGTFYELRRAGFPWTAFPADAPPRTWATEAEWRAAIISEPVSEPVIQSFQPGTELRYLSNFKVRVDIRGDLVESARGKMSWTQFPANAPRRTWKTVEDWHAAIDADLVCIPMDSANDVLHVEVPVAAEVPAEVPVAVEVPAEVPVAVEVPADESIVELAERIARKAHTGQTRRDGITPYIVHPADVAARLQTSEERAVGWLHDTLEDTNMTSGALLAQGVPVCVVEAVQALTRANGETYIDFIKRLKPNALAARVKRADIASNLSDDPTPAQIVKYASALALLDSIDPVAVPDVPDASVAIPDAPVAVPDAPAAVPDVPDVPVAVPDGPVAVPDGPDAPAAVPDSPENNALPLIGSEMYKNAISHAAKVLHLEPTTVATQIQALPKALPNISGQAAATKGWLTFSHAMATAQQGAAPVSAPVHLIISEEPKEEENYNDLVHHETTDADKLAKRMRRRNEIEQTKKEWAAEINAKNALLIEQAKRHRPVTRSMKFM